MHTQNNQTVPHTAASTRLYVQGRSHQNLSGQVELIIISISLLYYCVQHAKLEGSGGMPLKMHAP